MGRPTGLRAGRRPSSGVALQNPATSESGVTGVAASSSEERSAAFAGAGAGAGAGAADEAPSGGSLRRASAGSSPLEPGGLAERNVPPPRPNSNASREPMNLAVTALTETETSGGNLNPIGGVAARLRLSAAAASAAAASTAAASESQSQPALPKEGIRRHYPTVVNSATATATSTTSRVTHVYQDNNQDSSDPLELPPHQRPGAYTDTGMSLVRAPSFQKLRFSGTTPTAAGPAADYTVGVGDELFGDEEDPPQSQSQAQDSPNSNNTSNRSVVVATEVPIEEEGEEAGYNTNNEALALPTATGIDTEAVQQKKEEEQKKTAYYVTVCGLLVLLAIMIIVVAVIVANAVRNSDGNDDAAGTVPTASPTTSPTRPMPPMDNGMDALYHTLPEKTKESLFDTTSPQYQAWEWLWKHPDVTAYPEWRKKQVFAMASFFYSFEGPKWPVQIATKWLDVATSECAWVLSDLEVFYFAKQSADIFGPAYTQEDYKPCNDRGELQTLIVHQLYLQGGSAKKKGDIQPVMPPEIGLLTNVRILAIIFSDIGVRFSDLLVQELIELPNIQQLSLAGAGITGTIPTRIGLMTQLKTFAPAENALFGTIPTQIGNMRSLQSFIPGQCPGISGIIPTEVGLMTQLTQLELGGNSHTGQLPTQMGLLTQMQELNVWKNQLKGPVPWSQLLLLTNMAHLELDTNLFTGSIPSQLGLLTSMTYLELENNRLTGGIPTQVGLMTNFRELWLGNNALGGSLPSEMGKLSKLETLWIGNVEEDVVSANHTDGLFFTNFTGTFPTELWKLSHLKELVLPNLPNLSGSIPTDIFMPNLTMLSLSGSPLFAGRIPDQACSFKEGNLDFDCSDVLCGCDCQCSNNTNTNNNL